MSTHYLHLSPTQVLKKYWGYDSFREKQAEIIQSVLDGNDTLALLPTGGGKSLTFQIPALILPGLTLVVTPLISLMKDQVDNLRERGIKASVIHSGLSYAEVNLAMDRCRYGHAKLLYLSPERLQSQRFMDEIRMYDVSMIVVDEAHCISQWGHDFRPSYRKISILRKLFPQAVILALTASATPEVRDDIISCLGFRQGNVFSKSFARPNISYIVRQTEHKPGLLCKVLKSCIGSAIVYVRSRRRTREISALLQSEGITAAYYHAGLDAEEKDLKQNLWKSGKVRVMVATNAFGMGIDKPDVRIVVHIDPPSSLEEYYQEAGRAGRDGLPSMAVMITSNADKATLTRRLNEAFPDKDTIRRVYELAGNFCNVAVGSGFGKMFEFNFGLFTERFSLNERVTRSAMAILTAAGYVEYMDEVSTRSRVMVIMNKRELYDLKCRTDADKVLQLLLRTTTGLFSDFTVISEDRLASRLNLSVRSVYEALLELSRLHAIHYIPRKTSPYLIYTTSRELPKHVAIPRAVYEDMRKRMETRIDSIRKFLFDDSTCRSATILRYFGEKDTVPCGTCDVCRTRKAAPLDDKRIAEQIIRIASQPKPAGIEYIARQLGVNPKRLIPIIRQLMDTHRLTYDYNTRTLGIPK